jgi:hypothetical protein
MEITHKDFNETRIVEKLIKKVENVDLLEANKISERIVKNQPFIMSLLIGYKFDVKEEPLNDIMKMLFVIYLFFEESAKINMKQINSSEFEEFHNRNIKFLKYLSGEQNDKNKSEVNKHFLSNLRYKSLLTGILVMSNTQKGFKQMNGESKGIILIGIKTLIDCLESNLLEKKK